FFFFSSRRRHTRWPRDWSSDVCSSDLSVKRCFVPRPITAHKIAHTLYSFASHGGSPDPRRAAARPAYSFASHGGGSVTDSPRLRSGERRVGEKCEAQWAACAVSIKKV